MGLGCLARLEQNFNSLKSSLRFVGGGEIAEKAVSHQSGADGANLIEESVSRMHYESPY